LNARLESPLNDAEASDVLRYWLGLMRHQEALAARPKARRQDPRAAAETLPNLKDPVPGQQYAKLDWTERGAFFAARRGHVDLEFDAEARGFFEDWLVNAYRRGDDDEGQRVGHLLGFPTLLLPKGELGGLLRCAVDVRWLTAQGLSFSVPSYKQRAAGVFPEPPCRVRLVQKEPADEADLTGEEALPFFLDTKLLREALRVDAERLDTFFADLRKKNAVKPRAMLLAVCKLLEAQIAADVSQLRAVPEPSAKVQTNASDQLLQRLQTALTRRLSQLGSRTRSYPVALLLNADQSRATAHAQRDIGEALERIAEKKLLPQSPLSAYLRGQAPSTPAPEARERCLGRFSENGLTPHQLAATELSLNSRLCAIQGPPGTGKTTLILNRVADALVKKLVPLLSGYAMSEAVVVVTSTNNAAVDNVTTPLGVGLGPDRLPLALRVGSRDVTEKITSADLERSIAWLERHKEPGPKDDYDPALASFRQLYAAATAPSEAATLPAPQDEAAAYALFLAAERLRAAWAIRNRTNLLNVLTLALRAARSTRSLKKLLEKPQNGAAWLRRLFPAWGSTLLSLGNVFPAEPGCCEQVIIDEAGQCHPGYAVSALLRARSALVIGDVHQLEPVIGLSEEDERRIVRGMRLGIASARLAPYRTHDESQSSAQSLADRAVSTRPTLIDHFRCQPAIAAICERLCGYGLVTRTEPMSRSDRAPLLSAPVLFVPLAGEQERQGGSWMNPLEIAQVVHWVQHLIQQGINPDEIGVITPFRGQLDALWRELAAARVPLDQPGQPQEVDNNLDLFGSPTGRGLSLGTVHRFQGGEKSVILFSTTVTRSSSLRFLDQRVNLINVAASRARDHLITLGHEPTLREGQYTRALLADAKTLSDWELPFPR
jgi:hypothetical protein